VQLEPIRLADGSSALFYVGCDLIGLADEVALGRRPIPAETANRHSVRPPR
jgi:hypothetical protein